MPSIDPVPGASGAMLDDASSAAFESEGTFCTASPATACRKREERHHHSAAMTASAPATISHEVRRIYDRHEQNEVSKVSQIARAGRPCALRKFRDPVQLAQDQLRKSGPPRRGMGGYSPNPGAGARVIAITIGGAWARRSGRNLLGPAI